MTTREAATGRDPVAEERHEQGPELSLYTGHPSYAPGETLTVHLSSDVPSVTLTIHRDGARWQEMAHCVVSGLRRQPVPPTAAATGCQWPESFSMELPAWPSGGYVITARGTTHGRDVIGEAFFVLRATAADRARCALIASTYTWCAYNDWGGSCFYDSGLPHGRPSRVLSLARPWAPGQIRLPVGAPTMRVTGPVPIGWAVRHPYIEWALATGHSRWAGSGGWAAYDARMVRWLEAAGFQVDLISQWDLDRDPEVIEGYDGVLTCGHDEYWTGPGRRRLGEFIDGGGWHARFGANIMWQVRADWRAATIECWKFDEAADPLASGPVEQRTGLLEGRSIRGYPQGEFAGSGIRGGYSSWGGAAPRGLGGLIVYQPEHWLLAGTDAYYGDVLGGRSGVLGYECDGVEYDVVNGRPVPSRVAAPLTSLDIIALSPVSFEEEDHGNRGSRLQAGSDDLAGITRLVLGADTPEGRSRLRYGCAAVTLAHRGQGTIISVGTTGWPDALAAGDQQCETVTRTILRRLLTTTAHPARHRRT